MKVKGIQPKVVDGVRLCGLDICNNKLYARGYCGTHYNRAQAGKPVVAKPRKEAGGSCTFPECGRVARTSGLCVTHYGQQNRSGTMRPIRDPRESPDKPGLRNCKGCGEWKDREKDFYNGSRAGQKQNECKDCQNKRNRENIQKRKNRVPDA